ncbi:hypothetical protein [Methanosarcina barkeri]|nr:hypothetical protein [Methanosarcina barkeri]
MISGLEDKISVEKTLREKFEEKFEIKRKEKLRRKSLNETGI